MKLQLKNLIVSGATIVIAFAFMIWKFGIDIASTCFAVVCVVHFLLSVAVWLGEGFFGRKKKVVK